MGFAGDQGRLLVALGPIQRRVNLGHVMAVDGPHLPTTGGKTRQLVGGVRQRDLAVDRNAVVVPQYDQLRQCLTP